jgi:hypothetical protein
MDAIRNYNWKWLLELFYGLGGAVVIAAALFVWQNNPFEQPVDNFDTFGEWKTWGLMGAGAMQRAAWVAASSAVAKVSKAVLDAGGDEPWIPPPPGTTGVGGGSAR